MKKTVFLSPRQFMAIWPRLDPKVEYRVVFNVATEKQREQMFVWKRDV